METNIYLDKYIDIQAKERQTRDDLQSMGHVTSNGDLEFSPRHFNYFSLQIKIRRDTVSLTMKEVKELGEYLLNVSKGLDDTHDIMSEISHHQKKLPK